MAAGWWPLKVAGPTKGGPRGGGGWVGVKHPQGNLSPKGLARKHNPNHRNRNHHPIQRSNQGSASKLLQWQNVFKACKRLYF